MMRFIITRLLGGFFLLLFILLICLWMVRLIPGSYDELMKSEENVTQQNENRNANPIPLFYFSIIPEKKTGDDLFSVMPILQWNGLNNEYHQKLKSYATLRFGKSLIDGVEVKDKFIHAFPWSLILQIPAIILVIVFSLWIALKRIQYPDSSALRFIDNGLIWLHSIPGFWLATMLLIFFANPDMLQWLPSGLQAVSSENPFTLWFYYPQYLLLPLLCLVLPALAYLVRLIKNGLENSLQQLFWTRALSSGMSVQQALWKEAMPLAMIPMIAWFAGIFPALISGSLIIEQIFSIPGLGRLMYLSISMRDWPVVQFLFLFGSALTIIGFIVSDALLHYVDPRLNQVK